MEPFVRVFSDVPVESLRLRFALLQSLNNTLESFFLPLVELRQTETYQNSIAALLCEAKGEQSLGTELTCLGVKNNHDCFQCLGNYFERKTQTLFILDIFGKPL